MSVTTSLYGNMGNQLFQVANCIAYSLRHNLDYCVPTKGNNLGQITNFKFPNQRDENISPIFPQKGHGYTEIPYYSNVRFHGHFQSEKYFKDKKKEVRELLGFPAATNGGCAVHIRRGDYLKQPNSFPVLPIEYYYEAMSKMTDMGVNSFTFFSDDNEWCKENFNIGSFHENPLEDLKLMSSFKYQIIANSSYSLFASLINDKTVIAPHDSMWFGKNLKHLETKDLMPDHFIKIKVEQLQEV